ncbi:AMIN domain-containing protein [Synechococcus moorigangaii CMS01]|nr:AMIN domain-containing protein [Synechococcus moorigangaii CMS01]
MDFGLNRSLWIVVGSILLSCGDGFVPKAIADPTSELPPLETWAFDPQQQRLRLQTASATIPQYSRLDNPTRLVIDLTNTHWPDATLTQTYQGTIQQLRLGQFNETTTRIVLTWVGDIPPGWTPAFRRLPQADGSVIWEFDFRGAIATNPPIPLVFPPALLPPTQAMPIQLPPLPELP